MKRRVAIVSVALLGIALLVGGCGVQAQDAPETIDVPALDS